MAGEWTQDDILARFVALTKIARLMRVGEANAAKKRAIGYTAECIAQDLHKIEPQIFSPKPQAHFKTVDDIIDLHVNPGPTGIDQRRTLIERAEPYAPSSPLHKIDDDPDYTTAVESSSNSSGSSVRPIRRTLRPS